MRHIFNTVWLLTLFIPAILTVLFPAGIHRSISIEENRRMAKWPKIEWSAPGLKRLPDQVNDFVNDHFLFRDSVIQVRNWLYFKLFNESGARSITVGKDQWLFLAQEVESSLGFNRFSEESFPEGLKRYERYCELINRLGAKFVFLAVPNKATIYPEKLPRGMTVDHSNSRLSRLFGSLRSTSDCRFLDLSQTLHEARKDHVVYYQTDTHWNRLGAWKGYSRLMKELEQWFPSVNREYMPSLIQQNVEMASGDLAKNLGFHGWMREPFDAIDPGIRKEVDLTHVDSKKLIARSKVGLPVHVLMFRDSFTDNLEPYLSTSFAQIQYLATIIPDMELIAREKPDLVIIEAVERSL